ncbi:hypothetical protein [Companilactobacillus furfuricola]|uniref:hypothetical protein n=1 Tax=Companilactobacillus furfuricola TaxID=1462575 RepID=UPI000F78D203|nr:hypothetical protein [Companilactobacillus furfuricola]
MEETTYYSVMKKDELAIPWISDSQKIVELLKQDRNAMLLSMTGRENQQTKECLDHGMIETYEQETLDQLVNADANKNIYLDNAFTIMDDLDQKGDPNHSPYISALYLAAALAKKMLAPAKMTWMLDLAVTYGVGYGGKLDPKDFGITSWNRDDQAFIKKLIEDPIEPPEWNRNKVSLIFTPISNMYYFQMAQAFQDVMELMKLIDGKFEFSRLQIPNSFELIHMTFELAKFYPRR